MSIFTLEIFKGGVGAEGHPNMMATLESGTVYLRMGEFTVSNSGKNDLSHKAQAVRGELAGEVTVRSFGRKCNTFAFKI